MAKQITTAEFGSEVLDSDVPVLVDFFTTWCGPCKMMSPILEQLSGEFEGRAKIVKVDAQNEGVLANQFQITGVPTLVFMVGGREVDRVVGLVPPENLKAKLERLVPVKS